MPANLRKNVGEAESSWPANSSANYIDIDISLDAVPKHDRRSQRPKAHGAGKENACEELQLGEEGVAKELQSNLHIEIGDRNFQLYKFPLISKSGKLNRLVFELRDPDKDRVALHDIPGGAEAFETAVRFLYGKSVQLTPSNVAALRCAAEYLEMNDSLGEGSLVAKTEHYLNFVVLGSWKDSISVLKTCSDLKPWAEELEIVRRCSESVAWKASTDPHGLRWSYSAKSGVRDAPRSWWFDDVCGLYIDTFSKVISAVNVKGMDFAMVAAAVVHYAEKWLGFTEETHYSTTKSDSKEVQNSLVVYMGLKQDNIAKDPTDVQIKKRAILQGIVSLLPAQPDAVSCKFLLKVLRAACAVNAGSLCKTDLARRIGAHLDKASVDDLLIPAYSATRDAIYDIDVVHQIVEYYLQEQNSGISPPVSPTSSSTTSTNSGATSTPSLTTSASIRSASSVTSGSRTSTDRSDSGSSSSGQTSTTDSSSVSRRSFSGLSVSGSSISGSSITGSSVSGSTRSISRSDLSESSRSDESRLSTSTVSNLTNTSTLSGSEESVKPENTSEKKFFSTEGPTRRPQLPATTSNLKVAQLLEVYLDEVAKDSTIPLGKFVALADLFAEFPRESDDCVYRAIDAFLRSHPSLHDHERRKLCRVMDTQALSANACMHAASNERLPLRVVVQVLFTEQVKLKNAITSKAVINDKGVDSIRAGFSSSTSTDFSLNSSDPHSSTSISTDTSTTSSSTASVSSSSASSASAAGVSVPGVAPSVSPSAADSVASSLLPGGLNVKDTLRAALSNIETLKTAVQEIEMVKARLGVMDALQQEMENLNKKFMDLAHDYTGMTHQVLHDVEELTKTSKHKSGWTSGWKKMAKPFHSKDSHDLQKGYNHSLVSEKHVRAAAETLPPYHIVHPTDTPLLQAVKEPLQDTKAVEAPKVAEVKVEAPLKVIELPKVEPLKVEAAPQGQINAAEGAPNLPVVIDHAPKDQESHSTASASKTEKKSAAIPPEIQTDGNFQRHQTPTNSHHRKTPGHRNHQPRSHHSSTKTPDRPHAGRYNKDADSVSVSSDSSYSSTNSDSRPRYRESSLGHRHHHRDSSEDHHHRSSSGHGRHRSGSHHRHRTGSAENHSNHHRDRSPDDRHRRGHQSPDHHHRKDPNHHSKEPPRASLSSNHKDGSEHHSSHHSHHSKSHHKEGSEHHSGHHSHHSKPHNKEGSEHHSSHHRSHHHHHSDKKSYDSMSDSSDSMERPRHRGHPGL